jgi:death-on-curing protein
VTGAAPNETAAFTMHLGLAEALELRRALVGRFGGDPEPTDAGLLEAALVRPRSQHYRTLAEQAAALLHALATQRPFRGDNLRFAFALTVVFLRLNGHHVRVTQREAVHFMREQVCGRNADVARIARALERVLRAV